jgi:hypothetical protein
MAPEHDEKRLRSFSSRSGGFIVVVLRGPEVIATFEAAGAIQAECEECRNNRIFRNNRQVRQIISPK